MDISSIKSSRVDRPRRIILSGLPKSGKSTLGGQAKKPVFLPMVREEGIDALDVPTFPVIGSFNEFMEAVGVLYSEEHDFETVVVDSISTLEPIIWKETCRINGGVDSIEKVGGGFSKGYTEALKQWWEIQEALDALRNERNMTIILIAHVAVENFKDPMVEPYDRYNLSVHKKAAATLTQWADGILFVQRKVLIKKDDTGFGKKKARAIDAGDGTPKLYTQERPAHPGGGRGAWGKIPYELDLSWAALEAALDAARKEG